MSDPQSRPRDGDRKRAVEKVDLAYAEGRITAADRALRVGNIENASTLGELDIVVRDLTLEPGEVAPQMSPLPPIPPPPIQPSPPQAPPPVRPSPPVPPRAPSSGQAFRVSQGSPGSGFRTVILAVVGLVVLFSAGAVFFVAGVVGDVVGDIEGTETDPFGFPDPAEISTINPPSESPAAPVDRLALTVAGLRWFVGRYEEEFGTTRTLGVTIWADRASVDRPVHGGRRQEMWSYRDGEFEKFGSVTTNSRGTSVLDLRTLRLKPLVGNIQRARRTLNVENPETIYVIIENDTFGEGPEANIYVSNKYNESGYLATTFGGRVVRSYPFQR